MNISTNNNEEALYDTIKTLRFKLIELEKENRILKNDAMFYERKIDQLKLELENSRSQGVLFQPNDLERVEWK